MLRHRHRISKDVDIFVSDPQYLGFLTPRLNTKAESLTSSYIEQAGSLRAPTAIRGSCACGLALVL